MNEVNIFKSKLVPKHEILNDEEKAAFLNDLKITLTQLPRIKTTDPVVKMLQGSKGDIIKVTRDEKNNYFYYRVVV